MLTLVVPNLNTGSSWLRTFRGIEKLSTRISNVIVVDGFSNDNSCNLFSEALVRAGIRCEVYMKKPAGIIDAIRSGILHVKTKYVLVNLCGDELLNIPDFPEDSDKIIWYGDCEIHNADCHSVGIFHEMSPRVALYRMPHINMNTIVWPTDFIKNSISLMKNYRISSDHSLILEGINKGYTFSFNANIRSIFYKDGISSGRTMHAFGLGESFYIVYNYGSKIMGLLYAIYSICLRKVDISGFFIGYKHAKGVNK